MIPEPRAGIARRLASPLWATVGIALALWAQGMLDRWPATPTDGAILYALASAAWIAGILPVLAAERDAPYRAPAPAAEAWPVDRRRLVLGLGLVTLPVLVLPAVAEALPLASGLAILRYPDAAGSWPWRSNNALTPVGTASWLAGTALVVAALRTPPMGGAGAWLARRRPAARALWLLVAIVTVAAVFRFHDLPNLPREMTSDHTEKLLDIHDVIAGARPVFLDRNSGREPLQFYLTALAVALGLPYGFLAEKTVMALVSLFAVPLVYLAGREVGGRWLGLAAAALLASAPWHVQVARAAMRIGFAPLFVALVLFLLIRALRRGRRNDWLALGLGLGAGMYGYTAFRPMAFVVAIAVPLKLAHDAWHGRAGGWRPAAARARGVLGEAALAALVSVLVAAPLVRYAVDQPRSFGLRTMSRITGAEVPLVNPPWTQFRINMTRAALMVNRTSDSAWIHSPPGRPALETVGGALFVLGVVTALLRVARAGDWRFGIVLLGLPLMLLSSALALAFPGEVPHLGRASGALPMVAILAGAPLVALAASWRAALGSTAERAAGAAGAALLLVAALGAWPRVFAEYRAGYDGTTHNTSDAVAVARRFLATGGDLDHVWVVGWPHGWDYRVFGIELGRPGLENLLWDDASGGERSARRAADHAADPAAKLYLVGGGGAERSVADLAAIFPDARATRHEGRLPGKAFWSVYVPPAAEVGP